VTRLDRYIIRSILELTLICALALTTIFMFTSFVAELDEIDKGRFTLLQLSGFTLLNAPNGVSTLLPIITMLGTLMGMGNLAMQGELTAIRAAGVSNLRIGGAALMAGLILGLFGWVLADRIAPTGYEAAERMKMVARYGIDAGVSLKPVWLRDGPNIVRIGRLQSETEVESTTVYTLADDFSLRAITTIENGRYQRDHWVFQGVVRTEFAGGGARLIRADRLDWEGGLPPRLLRLFVLEARSLTADGLMQLIEYRKANGLDISEQRVNLWRKFVAPLTVMAMMFFAVPFVFGSLRSSGAGMRLLVGILVGVAFYVINEVTASIGLLYHWPPLLAAGLPTMALGAIGYLRLRQLR
jgi:lipopolysaccharide export system permease protein